MSVEELADRLAARLAEAERTRDAGPLLAEDAELDVLRLLVEAAPAPNTVVPYGPLLLVCWAYWYRAAAGTRNPAADRDVVLALALRNVLRPRLPDPSVLPALPPGAEEAEVDDLALLSGFACLMSAACTALATRAVRDGSAAGAAHRYDQGAAWLLDAHAVTPEDHEGFGDLSTALVALFQGRFEELAEPASLATAAQFAARACAVVPAGHPRQGALRPLLLDVVARAAVLLGRPGLDELEERLAGWDILPLPETLGQVERLRALTAEVGGDPGVLDAAAGLLLHEAAVEERDLPVLACAAERLRAALAALPPEDPRRSLLRAGLRDAMTRLGRDPGPPDVSDQLDTAVSELLHLVTEGGQQAGPVAEVADRILSHAGQLARERGLPDLPAEVRAALAFLDCTIDAKGPEDLPRQRLARYRPAWEALPADHPARVLYGTILATLAGDWAETMAADSPHLAAELAELAAETTTRVLAEAPAGSTPADALRAGHPLEARVAALTALAGRSWSAETEDALTRLGNGTVRALAGYLGDAAATMLDLLGGDLTGLRALQGLGDPDPGEESSVPATLRDLRTVLERFGEDDGLRRAGGEVLSAVLRTGDLRALDPDTLAAATELLRRTREHPDGPSAKVSAVLADLLTLQTLRTSDRAAVIEAAAIREAAPATEDDDSPAGPHLALRNATAAVMTRLSSYMYTHDPDQLERARSAVPGLLELAERAAAAAGADPREYRLRIENLHNLLDIVGPGGGPNPAAPDELLERCRRAFREAGQGEHRVFAGTMLIRELLQRWLKQQQNAPDVVDEVEALLDELMPELDPSMATTMRIVTAMLRRRSGETVDLSRFAPPQPATGAAPGAANKAAGGAANGLMARYADLLVSKDPLEAQIAMLRTPDAPLLMRAHSGIAAAVRALHTAPSGVDLALSLGAETVDLLERITDRGSPQQAAEHGLLTFDGDVRHLAALIATHLMHEQPAAGRTRAVSGPLIEATVALHERGRGLLLARRLESRVDLGDLTRLHPPLADRFRALTDRLDAPDRAAPDRADSDRTAPDRTAPDRADSGRAVSDRERLAGWQASTELDQVIEEIRAQPGFADFLGPLPPARLRELAAEGPIVVLNHVRSYHVLAFLVTPQEVSALRLDVRAEEVTDAAGRLAEAIGAIYARGGRRPPPAELKAARNTVDEVLSWTWHALVEPVLTHLGGPFADPGHHAPGHLPRLWWVPTGPFNALPLHAAQCRRPDCARGRCGSALDRVVSSYVPGFQTLAHARAAGRRPDTAAQRALVVSESDAVLPGAVAAARFAEGRLASPRVLIGSRATREAVLDELRGSQWVQFGCHAHSSPEQPAGSWIQLPSGETLSVVDICRIRPDSARLAVLTACGTARASQRLADEAVHISSAFLLAGYPEAVGTLWEIESTRLESFLRGFYDRLLADGLPPARALHHTVRRLRDEAPDRPYVWAAYIHAGV
ncbi:CHAT domain-containing protein [Kitasatospora sp. NPDC051170]|uniref:CHAT domain-containing protein n=1 Tax=Kitasatospora sp. NPDC051170 TaxID=3364056 RepID=UPI00379C6198